MKAFAPTIIVLAAGKSARMGSRNKLLLKIGDETIIERVVRTTVDTRIGDVIVVVGSDGDRVEEVLKKLRVRVIHNADHEQGMASSIQAGVRTAGRPRAGFGICLGDMPDVQPSTFERLADALQENPRSIVIPVYGGADGHPVFFGPRFYDSLLRLDGDAGGRGLIDRNADAVLRIPVDDPGILKDVDTDEDFSRYRASRLGESGR